MEKYEDWASVINRSFFHDDYHAYTLEESNEGIILYSFSKTHDTKAYPEDEIFLKREWILHVINTIRGVPKDELDRGTDGSGYGEWSRTTEFTQSDGSKIEFKFENIWYERSSPKLFITHYEKPGFNEIRLPHGYNLDGYIEYVEPVLCELEKYIPEQSKKELLEPLGKILSPVEKKLEYYKSLLKKRTYTKTEPYITWITEQTDNESYLVTYLCFSGGKLKEQKEIECEAKELAMAEAYLHNWEADSNELPFKKENSLIEVSVSENNEFSGYLSVKILFKRCGDFFEVTVRPKNLRGGLSTLFYLSEVRNYYTCYIHGLETAFDNEYLILKHYPSGVIGAREEGASLFYISKYEIENFLKGLKILELDCETKLFDRDRREFGSFSFDYLVQDNGITEVSVSCNNPSYNLTFKCFNDDVREEFSNFKKVIKKAADKIKKRTVPLNFERIFWKSEYIYESKRHYIEWQIVWDEFCQSEPKRLYLVKEKIFRIYETAFYWWYATNHSQKLIFEDDEVYFEIEPVSERKDAGTVELKLKQKPEQGIKTFFSLNDGTNLPKDMYDCKHLKDFLRKFEIADESQVIQLLNKSGKENVNASDYIGFNWWDSKYYELNENTRHFAVILKNDFDTLKTSLQKFYDYLKNPKHKMKSLLNRDFIEKFKGGSFTFGTMECTLEINGKNNYSVDENVPLHFTIYFTSSWTHEYLTIPGTRKYLLLQLETILSNYSSKS